MAVPPSASATVDLEKLLEHTPLTDQYGQRLDPKVFKDGEAIVLFGYGGCGTCLKISDTVAVVQEEMERAGKHMPIIVVSVNPDADKDRMQDYVASYYKKKVKQFASEKDFPDDEDARGEMGEKAWSKEKAAQEGKGGKPHSQGERLLHIVTVPTPKHAQDLEIALEMPLRKGARPDEHSALMAVFSKGKRVANFLGLPPDGEKDRAGFAKKVSADILSTLNKLDEKSKDKHEERGAPGSGAHGADTHGGGHAPRDATMLWNVLPPVVVGLGGILASGMGFSLGGLIAGLLAAGATSLVAQYATGAGLFAQPKPPEAPKGPHGEKKPEHDAHKDKKTGMLISDPARARAQAAGMSGSYTVEPTGGPDAAPMVGARKEAASRMALPT